MDIPVGSVRADFAVFAVSFASNAPYATSAAAAASAAKPTATATADALRAQLEDQPSWFFIDYRWRQCTLAAVPCSTN